jgi:hypothetical protein
LNRTDGRAAWSSCTSIINLELTPHMLSLEGLQHLPEDGVRTLEV